MSAWLEDSDIVYERRRTPSRSEPSFESNFDDDDDDDGIGGDRNDADSGILYMRSRSNGAPTAGSSAGRAIATYPYQYHCRYPYQYPYPLSYPRPAFEQTRSGSVQEQSRGGYDGGMEKNGWSREASRASGVGKEREGEKEAEAEFESRKDLRGGPLRRHAHSCTSRP
ncbi:hypothetical protein A7U60_g412 [Sanghuangporus baumii]|uniref:Uncharacterized protein n=1 Tax=Sanghuangporus baumii TaxID=108892 RepID=A0A9Q5I5Q7_SANBA|nr:hypothetical protein A7U60_g412 [Sanghuangporus baumii]